MMARVAAVLLAIAASVTHATAAAPVGTTNITCVNYDWVSATTPQPVSA
jgi:hypothetical protein